jgi:hypothetical protein
MEVCNKNIPAGVPSIADALSATSSLDIPVCSITSVSIQHFDGNQGILVNSALTLNPFFKSAWHLKELFQVCAVISSLVLTRFCWIKSRDHFVADNAVLVNFERSLATLITLNQF